MRKSAGPMSFLAVMVCAAVVAGVETPASFAPALGHPGARNAHAMAYDEVRGVTVLFGGADASAVRSDTWTWDGRSWRPLEVKGPAGRTFPAFVWDAARHEAVLFGGRRVLFGRESDRGTCFPDTWALRSDGWHQRAASGPPPRCEPGAAFDRHRGVVVLFGGYDDRTDPVTRLGDTWEWDGTAWHLRAQTGPAPRSGVAMAYDERLRRIVLFGGNGGPRSDTWTWDGVRWELVNTPETPGRFNSIAQYDAARGRLLRSTGWSGRARVRETWVFEHPRWRLVSSEGPAARNHSALAFDRRRRRLVLHGGHDGTVVFGDTWEWNGRKWALRVAQAPQRRLDNGH